MKPLSLGLILFALVADGYSQIAIRGHVSQFFGSTSYRFDALSSSQSNPNDIFPIASELEFPLDVWMAGFSADWQLPGGMWAAAASLAMNAGDPADKMTDDDWQRGVWIQHTESDATLAMLAASAEARRHLLLLGVLPVALVGSAGYERIQQDMIGYEGWYWSQPRQRNMPISGTEPSMNYRVTYLSPQAGLATKISLPLMVTLSVQSTAGVVFAWDTNDHLLRGKRAEGNATGFGTRAKLELGGSLFRLGPFPVTLAVCGDFRYSSASGTTTQMWYRDEQTSYGLIPAGTSYSGLPHDFRSTLYGVGVTLGVGL